MEHDVDVVGCSDDAQAVVDAVQLRHQPTDQRPGPCRKDGRDLGETRPRRWPPADRAGNVDGRA